MVTMQDIADVVGVSQATVSMALNGRKMKNGDIPQVTRERVLAAAKELGYTRNELALSVKRGRSNTVAYIIGDVKPISLPLLLGANEVVQNSGYNCKLFVVRGAMGIPEIARQCVAQMVAGVMCATVGNAKPDLECLWNELCPRGIPVALADANIGQAPCASVEGDNVGGAEMAVGHLLRLGHRRIGLLKYNVEYGYNALRRQGYLQALEKAGVAPDPDLEMKELDWRITRDEQNQRLASYLEKVRPTAVFCVSDVIASQLLLVAHSLGVDVPGRLSVVGYDNLEHSGLSIPPLTTIEQPFTEIGAAAAEILIKAIEDKEKVTSGHKLLPVRLVERESCAPPPNGSKRQRQTCGQETLKERSVT